MQAVTGLGSGERAGRARTIDVLMIGNCVDQGTDVATGASYREIAHQTVRRRHPEVEVRFADAVLAHITVLPRTVDLALRRGADIVMVAVSPADVRGPARINRLWSVDPGVANAVVMRMRAMRPAAPVEGTRRGALEATRWTDPLRTTVPAVTVEEYERILDEQVKRLRDARCQVIIRSDLSLDSAIKGRKNSGIDDVVARVVGRRGAIGFHPRSVFTGPAESYTTPKQLDGGEVSHIPDQAAHRLLAIGVEGAINQAVDRVLAARSAGEPPVLARVERRRPGLMRF